MFFDDRRWRIAILLVLVEGQEFRRLACVLSESQKASLYGEDFKWAATHTPQCGYFSEYGLYQKLVSVSTTMLDHNGSGVSLRQSHRDWAPQRKHSFWLSELV